ncbi:MAG: hypothetical protein QXD75_03675 [Desulfurococcaceae archaeon]
MRMPKFRVNHAFLYILPLLVMIMVVAASIAFSYSPLRTLVTLLVTAFSLHYITRVHITYFKLGVVEEGPIKLPSRLRVVTFRDVFVNLLFVVMLGGLLERALISLVGNVYLSLAISAVILVIVVNATRRIRGKRKTTYTSVVVLALFTTLFFAGLINDRDVEYFEHAFKLLEEVLHGA